MSPITPYTLRVDDVALDDLHRRLDHVRWPVALESDGPERGVPQELLRRVVEHWRTTFDWRAVEKTINAAPQYRVTLGGAPIHFRHHRSPHEEATPLLLTHGWPGAVTEFDRLVPLLTDPTTAGGRPEDAFHVVVPSLPGFGMSTPLREPGWDVPRIAATWKSLMASLGYSGYIAQGGDAGSPISLVLSMLDRENVRGVHLNMLMTFPSPGDDVADFTVPDQERLRRTAEFLERRGAYMQLMASSPQTLAYALTDSPVGLLAWVLERFLDWCDPRSLAEDRVTWDDILTMVSLYWFTDSVGSSANFYYEGAPAVRSAMLGEPAPPCPVPAAVSVFAHDTFLPARPLAERALPHLVQWREHERGGHFAALEAPEALAADLRDFAALLCAQDADDATAA